MSEPFLRIPLSEAEAHKRELAAAKARIAVLEAAGGTVTLEDLRLTLIEEADEDTGVIRACLEGDDVDAGDINVVDTILALCAKVRHLSDLLEGAKEINVELQAKIEKKRPAAAAKRAPPAAEALRPPSPCCCGCHEDGEHWAVSADIGDAKGGVSTGLSTVERAICWVVQESEGHRWAKPDGSITRTPYDRRTFYAAVAGVPLAVDAAGFWSAGTAKTAKAKARAKAKKPEPAVDEDGQP